MFDTYAAARALRNAGFDEPQAEAAVAVVRNAVSEGVATGGDAARLESKIEDAPESYPERERSAPRREPAQ